MQTLAHREHFSASLSFFNRQCSYGDEANNKMQESQKTTNIPKLMTCLFHDNPATHNHNT
jgi:hypothetical protein